MQVVSKREKLQDKLDDVLQKLILDHKIQKGVWAVGVSGGADSLALIYLLNNWAQAQQVRLVALTVNHKLRDEADDEAEYVSKLMKQAGIEHHTLVWNGEKPTTGIEEAARKARYSLLQHWCQQNAVNALFVAHHLRDQAETFLMRLQRGSGVDGLAAMQSVSSWNDLTIVRPLLTVSPEELRDYLQDSNIGWVEDPSNQQDDYLRVRIRKLLPNLEADVGLSLTRLADTAKRMGRVKDYLGQQTAKFVNNQVRFWKQSGVCVSSKALLEQHEEIGMRILVQLLKNISGQIYAPCEDEVSRLWQVLHKENFSGCTLAGCEIFCFQKKIWIIRELKNKPVLSKKAWEAFASEHPEFAKAALPYKLRLLLVLDSRNEV